MYASHPRPPSADRYVILQSHRSTLNLGFFFGTGDKVTEGASANVRRKVCNGRVTLGTIVVRAVAKGIVRLGFMVDNGRRERAETRLGVRFASVEPRRPRLCTISRPQGQSDKTNISVMSVTCGDKGRDR